MIKKFYEETGMYIDWQQLKKLPEIDTLIDVGVGLHGTEDLYDRFKNAKLILIDPVDEAKKYAEQLSKKREVKFFHNALGREDDIENEEGELVDPVEATIRNTMAMISESMKNIASWRFIKNMVFEMPMPRSLPCDFASAWRAGNPA